MVRLDCLVPNRKCPVGEDVELAVAIVLKHRLLRLVLLFSQLTLEQGHEFPDSCYCSPNGRHLSVDGPVKGW